MIDYFNRKAKVHGDHLRLVSHIAAACAGLESDAPELDVIRHHTNRAYHLAISDADYLSEYPRKEKPNGQ